MSYGAEPDAGALYRLDLDQQVEKIIEPVSIPNGIDWNADGTLMYFTDSATGLIKGYDYDVDTGILGSQRTVLDLSDAAGEPDGLTVDAEGNLWIAMWDGWEVRCYSPEGDLLYQLPVPVQRPTSVAFAGHSLTELYITTSRYGLSAEALAAQPAAGRLLRYRPGVAGRNPTLCRVQLTTFPTTEELEPCE